jgi:DNA-binding winged helix-turn-helix (wHTH) protein
MSTKPTSLATFGPFSLDYASGVLFRDRAVVPLEPIAAAILVALVHCAGSVVTRTELINNVLKKQETYDTQQELYHYISAVRSALGDDRDRREYIQTVPKRGYCFIAPVKLPEINGSTEQGPYDPTIEPTPLVTSNVSGFAKLKGHWLAVTGVIMLVMLVTLIQPGRNWMVQRRWIVFASDVQLKYQELQRQYQTATAASQLSFAEIEQEVATMEKVDPNNGWVLYFRAEILNFKERVGKLPVKPKDCTITALSTQYFSAYLEAQKALPKIETGGDFDDKTCFLRPSGFCPELTMYVSHLLANYFYKQAQESIGAVKEDLLKRTIEYADNAASYRDPQEHVGFSQCIPTSSLISLAKSELADHKD